MCLRTSLFGGFLMVGIFLGSPFVSAQSGAVAEVNRLIKIFQGIATIIQGFIIIAVACAFLWFFWGLAEYIRKEGGLEEAKKKIFWGLIAIFVLTSIWGIVYFLGLIFLGNDPGTRGTTAIQTFRLPTSGGPPGGGSGPPPPPPPTPINGRCSTAVNSCIRGVLEDIADTTTHYRWVCAGRNGGTADRCDKRKSGGVEGPPAGLGEACGVRGCRGGLICVSALCVKCNSLSSSDPRRDSEQCNPPTGDPDPTTGDPDPTTGDPDPEDLHESVKRFFANAPASAQIYISLRNNPGFRGVDPDFVTDDTDVTAFHSLYMNRVGDQFDIVCHNGIRTRVAYPDPDTFLSEDRDGYTAFFRRCFGGTYDG